jgi:hypothetical protein
LTYLTYPPADQFFEPPSLTDSELDYDIFSHELGLLSQRLVKLVISDTTLDLIDFFNSGESEWPRLERLTFSEVQIACANGTWYFNMDHRVDDYEEDPQAWTLDDYRQCMQEAELPAPMDVVCNPFRLVMDAEEFKDVYVATAKATKRMPKLRQLQIVFNVQGDVGAGPGGHGLYYYHGSRKDKENWYEGGGEHGIKVGWCVWPAVDVLACKEVFETWKDVGESKGAPIELYVQASEDDDDFRLVE